MHSITRHPLQVFGAAVYRILGAAISSFVFDSQWAQLRRRRKAARRELRTCADEFSHYLSANGLTIEFTERVLEIGHNNLHRYLRGKTPIPICVQFAVERLIEQRQAEARRIRQERPQLRLIRGGADSTTGTTLPNPSPRVLSRRQ